MSQHGEITKEIVSRAIKHNWSLAETKDHYECILGALEYDDDFSDVNHIINMADEDVNHIIHMADYMLTHIDGWYGVSHKQISDWKLTNNI